MAIFLTLEGTWSWHPLIHRSDLQEYWCCCCCIRTLQERTKQLLPLVITRHSVMIVALNNKSNSHDYKLSSCNKQKNVALYMCTMHRPLTCTESHHWSPLWWQMALNWSKRSWTAAPESENSTVSHLLKPHKSLEILDLLSNFEIKGQKFSISKLNIGFSPMSGWMGELTSFTWPSSSSSSKPLLWSFHSLPLPDTLIQQCRKYWLYSCSATNIVIILLVHIWIGLNFGTEMTTTTWDLVIYIVNNCIKVLQLTVTSGLSMESTGWSKVRWTSHPFYF